MFLIPLLVLLLKVHHYVNLFLYLAYIFCWMGDLLLIQKTELRKILGMLSFLVGHLLYSAFFQQKLESVSLPALLPYICISILYLKYTYHLMKKQEVIPSLIYLFVINGMSYLSFVYFLQTKTIAAGITWIGTVFFLISDTLISRQTFQKQEQRGVMETYAIAQLLIALGVIYGI